MRYSRLTAWGGEAVPESGAEQGTAGAGGAGSGVAGAGERPSLALAGRGVIGGALMGLANLVPGISGGTMLLAAGVYPAFVIGVAELSTLRFRTRTLAFLATVIGAAGLAILLLAGPIRTLVVEQRWVMYSLFVGLTLGGVPLVWRLARPPGRALAAGAVLGFAAMLALALLGGAGAARAQSPSLLFVSGVAGASAMILPGVSGGYLLLLLGQYEAILGAVDQLRAALLGAAGLDAAALRQALAVLVPVGVGVVVGVAGVSNLLRWLLDRHAQATLGALLGLLLGAVVGLWPFQDRERPRAGDVVAGRVLSAEDAAALPPEAWPLRAYPPSAGRSAAALGLAAAGLGATLLVDRAARFLEGRP